MIAHQTFPLDPPSPGALLRAVDALRKESGASFQLSAVSVVPGPGRFSRVRLGVVTANALAWALGKPLFVRGKRMRVVTPEYGAEPSISYQLSATSRKRASGKRIV